MRGLENLESLRFENVKMWEWENMGMWKWLNEFGNKIKAIKKAEAKAKEGYWNYFLCWACQSIA